MSISLSFYNPDQKNYYSKMYNTTNTAYRCDTCRSCIITGELFLTCSKFCCSRQKHHMCCIGPENIINGECFCVLNRDNLRFNGEVCKHGKNQALIHRFSTTRYRVEQTVRDYKNSKRL